MRKSKYDKYNDFILSNGDKGIRTITDMIIERYNLSSQAYSGLRKHVRNIKNRSQDNSALEQYCESQGLPLDKVSGYWHKGKHNGVSMSVRVDNAELNESITNEDIEECVRGVLKDFKKVDIPKPKSTNNKALKVVISDAHVGLEPNPDNESLFAYEYNSKIFRDNMSRVFEQILKEYQDNGAFDVLILEDLGDMVDGYNKQTLRGGHHLPQNMSNKEVFDTCVKARYNLIRNLMDHGVAKKYIIRSVTNDNHSGDFSWMIHRTVQHMLDLSVGENIEHQILDKFMEHFVWGDHCFIVTHGKDKTHMKHGLPLILNDKTVNFIQSYIDFHEIDSKYIHVEKGDLHQLGYQRHTKFDYRNYMSFAPASAWQQHNFGSSYSGFAIQIIPKFGNDIKHTDVFFDLKKNKC
jgi:hypothetical protein